MRWSVDHGADRPVYKQLADDLRDGIQTGELRPDERLPSEADLQDSYRVSLNTVRLALAILRGEGRVLTRPQQGTWVRKRGEVVEFDVPPGTHISTRMPTEEERTEHGIPEGTPILVVEVDGDITLYAGDRYVARTVASDDRD